MDSVGEGNLPNHADPSRSKFPHIWVIEIEDDNCDWENTAGTSQTDEVSGELMDVGDVSFAANLTSSQSVNVPLSSLTQPTAIYHTKSDGEKQDSDIGGSVVPGHSVDMPDEVLQFDFKYNKQGSGSKERNEPGPNFTQNTSKQIEDDLARREAELASNYATVEDVNHLKSQFAATHLKLDEIISKLEAGKLHASSFSTPSNQVTKSGKKVKRGPNSRWDKMKKVRVCQLCPEENAFEHKNTRKVRDHIFTVHNAGKNYECPYCGKTLCRAEVLKEHVKNVHAN